MPGNNECKEDDYFSGDSTTSNDIHSTSNESYILDDSKTKNPAKKIVKNQVKNMRFLYTLIMSTRLNYIKK